MSTETEPQNLRRQLRLWEAIALSVGIMAPAGAAALNGIVPAGRVGTSVPLAFLVAFGAMSLVAYGFIRLTKRFNSAGSVYALAGATLGPRGGFAAGWTLMGAYLAFIAATLTAFALFLAAFLDSAGIWSEPPWLLLAAAGGAVLAFCAFRDVRRLMQILIVLNLVSVAAVILLALVVIIDVAVGGGPTGQTFTLEPFSPNGLTIGAIAAGTVFAFTSFAGFEGAAALGEETREPRRNVPRALTYALIIEAAFLVLVMFAWSLGYGPTPQGGEEFAGSSGVFGDLGPVFMNRPTRTP